MDFGWSDLLNLFVYFYKFVQFVLFTLLYLIIG